MAQDPLKVADRIRRRDGEKAYHRYMAAYREKQRRELAGEDYRRWQDAIKAAERDKSLPPVPPTLEAFLHHENFIERYAGKAPIEVFDKVYEERTVKKKRDDEGVVKAAPILKPVQTTREVIVDANHARDVDHLSKGGRIKRIIMGGDILRKNRSEDGISRAIAVPAKDIRPNLDLHLPNPPKKTPEAYDDLTGWWGDHKSQVQLPPVERDWKPNEVQSGANPRVSIGPGEPSEQSPAVVNEEAARLAREKQKQYASSVSEGPNGVRLRL